jgi:3',5'-cyclic AMP phosphodiesterase CpdA
MTFTLAHISDPHLAPLPEPHWTELLNKRVTGYINWRRNRRFVHDPRVLAAIVADLKAQRPDHIACVGDLANIALPEEFERGRTWLEHLGQPRDVSLVPGNHDAYVRGALHRAKVHWAPYMQGDDGGSFPYLRRRGPLVLIGLTTAVPTAWGLAAGRLGARQVTVLAGLLDALKFERLFRVVLIHHPPVSAAPWHKRLFDAGALKQEIAVHGADLVLHGHDHLAMLGWLRGAGSARVPAVGVPSASARPGAVKAAAGYNLYRIDGRPGAWTCEMISRRIDKRGAVRTLQRVMLKS